jgi:hypothetical protein
MRKAVIFTILILILALLIEGNTQGTTSTDMLTVTTMPNTNTTVHQNVTVTTTIIITVPTTVYATTTTVVFITNTLTSLVTIYMGLGPEATVIISAILLVVALAIGYVLGLRTAKERAPPPPPPKPAKPLRR